MIKFTSIRHLVAAPICAASLLTFSATAQAPNDVRIALVIGNSAYPGNMALANPANDAKDMAATLRNMGFTVVEGIDSDRSAMMNAIQKAGQQLQGRQGVGMLFYAGHGLQLDWRNYMVPIDAKLANASDVPKQTVDIESVMTAFKSAGNRMNIVILDACRDNPFADNKTSTGKGLAPLDAPTGTFLAYATAPGNVAADGDGKNGLYTSYLLQELNKPNARIEDVFKRVRFAVRKASNGTQIPWETTSLEDDFVFNSGIKKLVKLTDDQKDKQFEIEKADWDKIKDSKSADPFYAFVQKYPTGLLTASAQSAIDRLNEAKTKAYTDKTGTVIQTTAVGNYTVGTTIELVRKDGYSNNEILRQKRTITSIQNGLVNYSDGTIGTTSRELVREANGAAYDPPLPQLPADGLAVGKKWHSRVKYTAPQGSVVQDAYRGYQYYSGETRWLEANRKVTAYETITVPAGTFKAYKIESQSIQAWGYQLNSIYWIEPVLGFILKATVEARYSFAITPGRGGMDRWTEELVSITRGS